MTKLSKILKYLAVGVFLLALAVNVKVSLSDPFVGMSEEAIAQTTSETGSTGGTGGTGGTDCNLCVVSHKKKGKTIIDFSCKPKEESNCSTTKLGHTLSCKNAEECAD